MTIPTRSFTMDPNESKYLIRLKKIKNSFLLPTDKDAARWTVEHFTIFDPIFVDFAEQFILNSNKKINKTK